MIIASPAGNRVWAVETPVGTVVQKLYREREVWLRRRVKNRLEKFRGLKTASFARTRRATERELLALWAEHGFDVPADLTDAHPELCSGDEITVLEFIHGRIFAHALTGDRLPLDRREALLRQFATDWGQRHAKAIELGDARLVHEHGSLKHVLWSGDRLVTFDLENSFRAGADPRPLIGKEIAGYLRSLAKCVSRDALGRDIAIVVDAYPHPDLLHAAVTEYLDNPRRLRRTLWAIDERRSRGRDTGRSKYDVLRILRSALER